MQKRFMCIWFRHLLTDRLCLRRPELSEQPVVFITPERNRMVITAANALAEAQGARKGITAADAKAITTGLQTFDHVPGQEARLLKQLAIWCTRYTPTVAVDGPDGLILDITGCTHLWQDERGYLKEVVNKLRAHGYDARAAIADTIGAAWAVSRFGVKTPIIEQGQQLDAIVNLPPAALRLDLQVLDKLHKLGFQTIKNFVHLPRTVLRRRFGENFLTRIAQALGNCDEVITPIIPPVPYSERLPCLEPVRTEKAIQIAIEQLLMLLCERLRTEGLGVRKALLKCYRIDGVMVKAGISTNRGTYSVSHLQKLFDLQISKIEPALGIDLFVMEAPRVEEVESLQERLWAGDPGLQNTDLAELLDRVAGKIGEACIKRFLPAEHYWPERAMRAAISLKDKPAVAWPALRPRPLRLLDPPKRIDVSAKIPDDPPMVFVYKNKRHEIVKADGPERIEREWWCDEGAHRDYYAVEDRDGQRYWVFRLGHYDEQPEWYLHGFFA